MHIYKICIEWKTDWSWVINTIHESNQWYTNGKGGGTKAWMETFSVANNNASLAKK